MRIAKQIRILSKLYSFTVSSQILHRVSGFNIKKNVEKKIGKEEKIYDHDGWLRKNITCFQIPIQIDYREDKLCLVPAVWMGACKS